MGKIENSQQGFSAVKIVIVLFIVAIIGGLSFIVYKNMNNKQSVAKTSESIQKPDNAKPESTPSTVTVVTKESLQGTNTSAPRCGSQTAVSQAQPNSFNLKYTQPKDWSTFETYPNGVSYKSTDFNSEQGFKNISAGASLTLAVQAICTNGSGLAEDMESYAQTQTNESEPQLTYIKVSQYYGVRFKYNVGEDHNNHDVALLFKDNKMYTVEEQFSYSAINPYSNIIDQTLDTIE